MREFSSKILELSALAQRSRFNAKVFAKLCGVSLRQLQRDFKLHFGCSPQLWLNEQRIAFAGKLLVMGECVKSAGATCGFKQTSHFCRAFKTQTGMTPSQFLRELSQPFVFCVARG